MPTISANIDKKELDAIVQIIAEHCGQGCPPNCVGVGAESTIF